MVKKNKRSTKKHKSRKVLKKGCSFLDEENSSENSDEDFEAAAETEKNIAPPLALQWWKGKYSDDTTSPALYTAKNFGLAESYDEGMFVAERVNGQIGNIFKVISYKANDRQMKVVYHKSKVIEDISA